MTPALLVLIVVLIVADIVVTSRMTKRVQAHTEELRRAMEKFFPGSTTKEDG